MKRRKFLVEVEVPNGRSGTPLQELRAAFERAYYDTRGDDEGVPVKFKILMPNTDEES